MATYIETLRTPVRRHALLGQPSQCVFAFEGVFEDTILGCRRIRVLKNVEDEGQDGEIGSVHREPKGSVEETPLVHSSRNVDDVP